MAFLEIITILFWIFCAIFVLVIIYCIYRACKSTKLKVLDNENVIKAVHIKKEIPKIPLSQVRVTERNHKIMDELNRMELDNNKILDDLNTDRGSNNGMFPRMDSDHVIIENLNTDRPADTERKMIQRSVLGLQTTLVMVARLRRLRRFAPSNHNSCCFCSCGGIHPPPRPPRPTRHSQPGGLRD